MATRPSHSPQSSQRSEAELERFFSLSLDMLCIAGMDGYFKRLNPAFHETLGYTDEEMLARPILDFVHPDDRPATLAEMGKLSQGAPTLQFENRYQCRDGTWKWLSWKSQPFPDEGLMFATARDITALKSAERELREAHDDLERRVSERTSALAIAEARFRRLVEQSITGIYVIQGERFVYVNPKMTEIFGRSSAELTSAALVNFVFEEDREMVTGNVRKREQGVVESMHYSLRAVRGDGKVIDVEAHGGRIEYNGRPAILGTLLDISERKQAEVEIQKLNTELEQRVRDRTAQLEEANRELEAFSYSVSHDLRAPLRHIQGYADMLAMTANGQLSEKATRYLKTINEASAEMGQLIDDLLGFSRMGRVELHESITSLDEVVQDAIDGLEMATRGRRIVWKKAPLPEVLGDPSMLRQVYANLLCNAVKYTRGREPAEIETGCEGTKDGRVILFVRDNGAGFDMKYAHKLFGVFQRLHRADEFEGTGIGLASVRRIISRHGGRTWAEGSVGRGATFYFTLHPASSIHSAPPAHV